MIIPIRQSSSSELKISRFKYKYCEIKYEVNSIKFIPYTLQVACCCDSDLLRVGVCP